MYVYMYVCIDIFIISVMSITHITQRITTTISIITAALYLIILCAHLSKKKKLMW